MAAGRVTLAVSAAQFCRLSPLTHTNFIRNGAVLTSAASVAPSFSISCTFPSFSNAVPRCRNLAILARATEVGSENADSVVESEDLATEAGSRDVATEAKSREVSTEVGSEVRTEQQGSKLYVGNLSWECESAQLAEICQEFGTVEMVEVIYDQETGRSRGFAFVTMASNEDARAVIKALDGSDQGGRVLQVDFPRSSKNNPRVVRNARGRPGNVNKMFVSNFPWVCDDEALTLLFSGYGKVVDAKVVYDKETGRSRGFGFVTMDSAEEVNAALKNLNGADYEGRELKVALVEGKKPTSPGQ